MTNVPWKRYKTFGATVVASSAGRERISICRMGSPQMIHSRGGRVAIMHARTLDTFSNPFFCSFSTATRGFGTMGMPLCQLR